MNRASMLKRIDELIVRTKEKTITYTGPMVTYEVYTGTLTIVTQLYGATCPQLNELKGEWQRVVNSSWGPEAICTFMNNTLAGALAGFRGDIVNGLLDRIEAETRGEIYVSLTSIATECLENGAKDAAAVLATAALEDALKKYGSSHGADMDGYDMSGAISRLKGKSLLQATELKVAQSFVTLRNKAMHAEWNKIGEPEIAGVIAFVEQFVLTHFTNKVTGEDHVTAPE